MAVFLAAMNQLTPYLEKHTVLLFIQDRTGGDRRVQRLTDGRGTAKDLRSVYYDLCDRVLEEFPPSRYGLEIPDLERVVLQVLDPLHEIWPEHPRRLWREWPHWDPGLHLP